MTKFTATFLLALSAALSLQGASVFASPISSDGALQAPDYLPKIDTGAGSAEAGYRGPGIVQAVPVAAVQAQVAAPSVPLLGGILNGIPIVGPLLNGLLGGGGGGGGLLGGLLGGGGGGGGGLLGGLLKVDVGKTDDAN